MTPTEVAALVGKMKEEEFEKYALEILHRELGVYGLARFIRLNRSGSGDYTSNRHQWLDGVSIEDAIALL